MGKEKEYRIKAKFVFEGEFVIRANSRSEAVEHVTKDCGMTEGRSIHSSLPDDMVDWEFPVHPRKVVR